MVIPDYPYKRTVLHGYFGSHPQTYCNLVLIILIILINMLYNMVNLVEHPVHPTLNLHSYSWSSPLTSFIPGYLHKHHIIPSQ